MDELEINFSTTLKKHVDKQPYGYISKLASQLGLSQGYLSNLVNGRRAGSESIRREIAKKIHTPYDIMIGIEKTPPPASANARPLIVQTNQEAKDNFINTEHYRAVPLYESGRIAAWSNGAAFDLYEEVASHVIVYMPELGHRTKHKLVAAKVGGDSMEPLVPKDSIIIIDMDDKEFVDNKIFTVAMDEGGIKTLAVKRVRKFEKAQGFVLWSENQDYQPVLAVESNWLRLCVGRVVWMWRSFEG